MTSDADARPKPGGAGLDRAAVAALMAIAFLAPDMGAAEHHAALSDMAPKGTLLVVTGEDGHSANFDLAALEALPQVHFATRTIWTEGVTEFSGPPLRAVLERAGIAVGTLELWAINDYMAVLDMDQLDKTYPIIATRVDGATFSARDNGPLWVVYPYDADEEFRSEEAYASSVWQLVRIEATGP